jgi:hypothetical protein
MLLRINPTIATKPSGKQLRKFAPKEEQKDKFLSKINIYLRNRQVPGRIKTTED